MAGERETKNLGFVKAIHDGENPPLNKKMIWYDTVNFLPKYYDVSIGQWVPLGGSGSFTVNGTFSYVAFAEDCSGSGFSLQKEETSTHWALVVSATQILPENLNASLFDNRWTAFCSASSSGGNFTYVRYADDCEGNNFADTPSYEVPCKECNWIDGFEELNKRGDWTITPVADGIKIDFVNLESIHYIELELTEVSDLIPNNSSRHLSIEQTSSFTSNSDPNQSLTLITDPSSNDSINYNNSPNSSSGFDKVFNGSKLKIESSSTNTAMFSGSIIIKIGNLECGQTPKEICEDCRKYMAILVSDVEIENIIPSLFEELWIPINSCGCGCGDSKSLDSENLSRRINNLNEFVDYELDLKEQSIQSLNNSLSVLQTQLSDEITTLNDLISTNEENRDSQILTITNNISDLNLAINGILTRLNNIELTLTETGIMDLIGTAIDDKINSYKTIVDSQFDGVNIQISDHETRLTNLETV